MKHTFFSGSFSALPALCVLALFFLAGTSALADTNLPLAFNPVRPGVEFAMTSMDKDDAGFTENYFIAIRIDPKKNVFALCMASEKGEALSLADWCAEERLLAGINAGMYLPDKKTNTGYMRNGDSINNAVMGGRLGAFFVADRKNRRLPQADILERSLKGWQARLYRYGIVAQNYRLVSSQGELLWEPGKAANSIAVVAKDAKGRILLVLCQKPLTVEAFTYQLKRFIPDVGVVMYVEGGTQAGIFLRVATPGGNESAKPRALPGATVHHVPGGFVHVWKGRQSLLGLAGSSAALLPNIIGVRQ